MFGFDDLLFAVAPSIVNGIFGSESAGNTNQANLDMMRENNAFNAEQAQLNREFQNNMFYSSAQYNKTMAETQYQRAVGDMKSAGLNPMLAYSQGGNASPSVAAPSGNAASASGNVSLLNKGAAAVQAASQIADIGIKKAQAANIEQDTKLKEVQATREVASADNLRQQTTSLSQQMELTQKQILLAIQEGDNKVAQRELMKSQSNLAQLQAMVAAEEISKKAAEAEFQKIQNELARYELPGAAAAAGKAESWVGQKVSPWVNEITRILNSAGALHRSR